VDTVGGLLAQRLGRVPLPGAEAEISGLRLRAEGGEDARGRMRIRSLLVWRQPVEEAEPAPAEDDRVPTGDDARRAGGDLAQTGARDGKDDRG
jgi:hypothetical protein